MSCVWLNFSTQMSYIFQGECHHYEIVQNVNFLFLINLQLFAVRTIHQFELSPLKLLARAGELLSQCQIHSLSTPFTESSSEHVGQNSS